MLRYSMRLLVALVTFTIGISIFWALQLIPHLEAALVDHFFTVNIRDVSPIGLENSDDDTNEIYRLLVHRKFIFNDQIKLIVFHAETTGCPMYEDESFPAGRTQTFHEMMKETMPEADRLTLDNYLLRNKTPETLKVSNLGIHYVLVKNGDLHGSWFKFYAKYPNSPGIVYLSKVGFNARHDQAFLYAARSCGGLCGAGEYVLLAKVNGKWEVRQEQELWVS